MERPLRIAYAIEFLLALIACFECWSQIGGQAPLDLMPWWLKLLFAAGFAAVVVRLTVVTVQNHSFPSVPVVRWGVALILLLAIIAVTTYYYYLRVPPDEDNIDETVPTSYVVR
jgi:glucan phosphoethanolaminetransferase (alkaline phosphatase superfamily)